MSVSTESKIRLSALHECVDNIVRGSKTIDEAINRLASNGWMATTQSSRRAYFRHSDGNRECAIRHYGFGPIGWIRSDYVSIAGK